jgi:hypothetical protein
MARLAHKNFAFVRNYCNGFKYSPFKPNFLNSKNRCVFKIKFALVLLSVKRDFLIIRVHFFQINFLIIYVSVVLFKSNVHMSPCLADIIHSITIGAWNSIHTINERGWGFWFYMPGRDNGNSIRLENQKLFRP